MNPFTLSDNTASYWPIENSKTALASVMREKMKPSDRDYAQTLVRLSEQRSLSATEINWLTKFAAWYDQYNSRFWSWWENGGREETLALQNAGKVTAPQARPPAQKANANPQQKASATPTSPTPGSQPPPETGAGNGKTYMLIGVWALVAVAGYGIYRTFKNGK